MECVWKCIKEQRGVSWSDKSRGRFKFDTTNRFLEQWRKDGGRASHPDSVYRALRGASLTRFVTKVHEGKRSLREYEMTSYARTLYGPYLGLV